MQPCVSLYRLYVDPSEFLIRGIPFVIPMRTFTPHIVSRRHKPVQITIPISVHQTFVWSGMNGTWMFKLEGIRRRIQHRDLILNSKLTERFESLVRIDHRVFIVAAYRSFRSIPGAVSAPHRLTVPANKYGMGIRYFHTVDHTVVIHPLFYSTFDLRAFIAILILYADIRQMIYTLSENLGRKHQPHIRAIAVPRNQMSMVRCYKDIQVWRLQRIHLSFVCILIRTDKVNQIRLSGLWIQRQNTIIPPKILEIQPTSVGKNLSLLVIAHLISDLHRGIRLRIYRQMLTTACDIHHSSRIVMFPDRQVRGRRVAGDPTGRLISVLYTHHNRIAFLQYGTDFHNTIVSQLIQLLTCKLIAAEQRQVFLLSVFNIRCHVTPRFIHLL